MFKNLLAVIFIFGVAFAQTAIESVQEEGDGLRVGVDFAQQDPFLSDRYRRGPYLIYDCQKRHWVCSGLLEYERCEQLRQRGIDLKAEELPCASFAVFKTRELCRQKQLEMINRGADGRFCLHPLERKARMDF